MSPKSILLHIPSQRLHKATSQPPTRSPRLAAVTQETRASLFVNSAAFIRAQAPVQGGQGGRTQAALLCRQAGRKETA